MACDGMIDYVAEQVERMNDRIVEMDERLAFFEGFYYAQHGKIKEYNEWLDNVKKRLRKEKWGD